MKFRSFITKLITGVFNRLTLTILVIVAQAVYVGVILSRFSDVAGWVDTSFRALSFLTIAVVIYSDHVPAYKIGWIVLIAILPQMGCLLYLIYGSRRPARSMKRRLEPVELAHREELKQKIDLGVLAPRRRRTAQYLVHRGQYPAWNQTEVRYYPVGDRMFEDLLSDLKRAEHFIFLEYFIIARGKLWDWVFEILKEKAAAGVDVRVLCDDIGSIRVVPRHFIRDLREAGIQVMAFNTVRPILSLVYNHRDHRKIAVIDGCVGYTGGANLADEYANLEVRFGHWKDGAVRLYGEGVWNLTVMFLNMWNAFDPRDSHYQDFAPHRWHPAPFPTDGLVQPFSDTPLDDEPVGRNVYLELISQAERYVYLYTPYLILDNDLETALRLAAKRGVDVRLVTPGIPDKRLIYSITRSFYGPLFRSGVKIYEYSPGFIHSKCCLADGEIGLVGTINLDFRSLYLHFEDGVLIMENRGALGPLEDDFHATFRKSRRVSREDLRRYPLSSIIGFFLRVLSPLL